MSTPSTAATTSLPPVTTRSNNSSPPTCEKKYWYNPPSRRFPPSAVPRVSNPAHTAFAELRSISNPGCTEFVTPRSVTNPGCADSATPRSVNNPGCTEFVTPPRSVTNPGCADSTTPRSVNNPGCADFVTPRSVCHPGCADSTTPRSVTNPECTEFTTPRSVSSDTILADSEDSLSCSRVLPERPISRYRELRNLPSAVGASRESPVIVLDHEPAPLPSISSPALSPKWQRGKFVLQDLTIGPQIGTGRTGTVRVALVTATGQQVACKFIELQNVTCAEAELSTLELLPRHPAIISYLGHTWIQTDTEINGHFWRCGLVIIMEYMPCESVQSALQQFGAFDDYQVIRVTREMCRGLCALHDNGICHRDLKSQNVLLGRDGEAKLSDFGTARTSRSFLVDSETPKFGSQLLPRGDSMSSCGSIAGTILWMAPEIVRGMGVRRSSDIWSLGCVVYEMACNKVPWEGENFDNELAAMHKIGFGDSSPMKGVDRQTMDPRLWDFLQLCFQRNPHMRPSAAELLETPYLMGGSITARPRPSK